MNGPSAIGSSVNRIKLGVLSGLPAAGRRRTAQCFERKIDLRMARTDDLEALALVKPGSPWLIPGVYGNLDRIIKDFRLGRKDPERVLDFSRTVQIGAFAEVPAPDISLILEEMALGLRQRSEVLAWAHSLTPPRHDQGIKKILADHLDALIYLEEEAGFLKAMAILRNLWTLASEPFSTRLEPWARDEIARLCRNWAQQQEDEGIKYGLEYMGRNPDRGLTSAPTGYGYLEDPIVLDRILIEAEKRQEGAFVHRLNRTYVIGPNRVKFRH